MVFNIPGWFSFEVSTIFFIFSILFLIVVRGVYKKMKRTKTELKDQSVHRQVTLTELQIEKESTVIPTIQVSGPIMFTQKGVPAYLRGVVSFGDVIAQQILALADDPSVKAAIIEFSTPGGSPAGSELIRDAIQVFAKKKLIVSHIGDMSASGGVWAMVAANKVFAQTGSLTGSIGVLGPALMKYEGVTEMKGMFGKGVIAEKITGRVMFAGKGKALGHPFAEVDEEAIAGFQKLLDNTYDHFVTLVAEARGTDPSVLKDRGAAIFDNKMAMEMDLIDGVKSRSELEAYIVKELNIKEEDCMFVYIKQTVRNKFTSFFVQLAETYLPHLAQQHIQQLISREPVQAVWAGWYQR